MSDRSVTVRLNADIAGFQSAITKAQLQTKDFAHSATKAATEHRAAWDKVGKGMFVTGGVMAAGLGLAVKSFADFDASMSRAQAGTMATGKSLAALRTAAVAAGAKTQFSATEAADAITAMGKAGVSTNDILAGGLTASLSLAAAGELDVGRAAEIAATAMTQFGLKGSELPHVADLLAAGAGKAQGSVDDLAGALKYVGPVSKGLGVSIEETTGVLAEFASQGIIGEQAGTSLRGVMLSLTSPSKLAAKTMGALGISVYDTAGQFVGMDGVAGQLKTKLGGLDEATRNQALGQIFGNEQITAARVLYDGGSKAVTDWTAKVNDAGFAARQAAMLTNNLKGDLERLGGSLSSVLIGQGSASGDALRSMVKDLDGAVKWFGRLPEPVQQTAGGLTAVTAAALLTGGAVVTMVPKVVAAKVALDGMGGSAVRASTALKFAGAATGVVAVAGVSNVLAGMIGKAEVANVSAGAVTASLDKLGTSGQFGAGGLRLFSEGMGPLRQNADDTKDALERFGTSAYNALDKGWDAKFGRWQAGGATVAKFGKQVSVLDAGLAQLVTSGRADQAAASFQKLTQAAVDQGVPLVNVQKAFTKYQAALDGAAASTNKAGSAGNDYYNTVTRLAHQTKTATFDVKGFDDALKGLFGQTFTVEQATDSWQGSLNDLSKAVKDNGRTVEGNTPKALANREALRTTAQRAYDLVQAYADTGASSDKVTAKSKTLKAEFVQQAEKAGYSREAAERYAGSLDKIPKTVKTNVSTPGIDAATRSVNTLRDAILSVPNRQVSVSVATGVANKVAAQGNKMGFAEGGRVSSAARAADYALASGGPMPCPPGMDPLPVFEGVGE